MRPTTSSRATTWSRVSTKGPLAPSWRMVIMVEAGAVLAARAARTMEKDRSSPSTPLVRTNTAAEASRDSATVTTTTRRPFFFRVENWKKLPGAEGDEGQGHVRQEVHAVDHRLGHQPQAAGTQKDAGENVGRHVRQPQTLGHPGGGEACEEHEGDGDDHGRGGGDVACEIGTDHGKPLLSKTGPGRARTPCLLVWFMI